MSRLAVTIGFPHDAGQPAVITGPEVPLPEHRTALHALKAAGEHPKYGQVEIWTSDAGLAMRKKLARPASAAATVTKDSSAKPAEPKAKKK